MKTAARVLLLLFLIVPVRAEEPARFLIERIDVRHLVHASPDVIKSESHLREGQAYSENDLRAANNLIKRLPFVLDAAFSLERGSVRDSYVLVITVNEARPLFYLFDAEARRIQATSSRECLLHSAVDREHRPGGLGRPRSGQE
jgi:hypothetical protein